MLNSRLYMALLSVLAAVLCSTAANAQRSLPGIEIQIDNWSYIPTLYNGAVESFIALRTDAPEGSNITAMWFTRGADNTWSSWAWNEQNQSKTTGYVKTVLQISDEDDGNWRVAPSAVNPDDFPPQTMIRGVFANDPFAETVSSEANPEAILDFLVSIGWSAAKSTIIGSSHCDVSIWMTALSTSVEAELQQAGSGMSALQIAIATNSCVPPSGPPCPYSVGPITVRRPLAVTVTPVGGVFVKSVMHQVGGGCYVYNSYTITCTQIQWRDVVRNCSNCIPTPTPQFRTRMCTITVGQDDTDHPFVPCPSPLVVPTGYVPPIGGYSGTPTGTAMDNNGCSWPDWPLIPPC